MGFMDLSVVGSDQAADSASLAVDAFTVALEKEFGVEGNNYNTPGPLNVSMIISEMCSNHTMFVSNYRLQVLAKKCMTYLKKTPKYGDSTASIKKSIAKFIKDGGY
jgi:hypothetical protein